MRPLLTALTALTAVTVASVTSTATASPLKLEYCITDVGGGVLQYQFKLTLNNNDGSWSSGLGYNWIIFGDVASPGPSNFADFVGDLPAPPPFDDEGWSFSSGGHNGPTLLDFGTDFDFRGWIPTAVGQSLTWSGRSSIRLGAGEMAWSNIVGTGVQANYEIATLLTSCDSGTCAADFDGNGFVNGDDYDLFVNAFFDGDTSADFDGNGFVNGDDFDAFADRFEAGC